MEGRTEHGKVGKMSERREHQCTYYNRPRTVKGGLCSVCGERVTESAELKIDKLDFETEEIYDYLTVNFKEEYKSRPIKKFGELRYKQGKRDAVRLLNKKLKLIPPEQFKSEVAKVLAEMEQS